MPDELRHLNKEDLFLLMESYRNMITMHSTLAEQQKQIIDLQNNIISKQDVISFQQTKEYDQISNIVEKINICSTNISETSNTIQSFYSSIDKALISNTVSVKERIGVNQIDNAKQHSGLTNRLYISMGVMASIVIALIGLVMGLSEKYDMLKEVHEVVNQISNYLNINK